ncbi:uracil-5-carboxylate decarboxylase [Phyllosticta citriasiana]|uniref:Uracil-5-carboxylate decarboxylase n=1 Tax=Phyllosticta citriasiana TaxID=595635 RepID=A0ABR1KVM6_9PEZI
MPTVDVHTHIYPPSYMSLLRARTTVPYVRNFSDAPQNARLIILPGEDALDKPSTARGRPIGPEYFDITEKLKFMDTHGITKSVISLANPWLDFLPPEEAGAAARNINDEVDAICSQYPGRLYAFGTLPLSAPAETVVAEVKRLKTLKFMRGIIMGTSGLGKGLDDPALDPIYAALEEQQLLIFLHPHYGLPSDVYGPQAGDYGHVLPLSLGFPLETTIAVTRMLLSGVWERFKELDILIAHSGGTLPFLAGRIESCIKHDSHLKKEGRLEKMRSVWDVLKENVYLDAVIYSEVGLKAAVEASGADRLMFGTDHPFFPPLDEDETEWLSVKTNYAAIKSAFGGDEAAAKAVLGGNAVRILKLD